MHNDDWGTTPADWQPTKTEPTFKQDLGGFLFFLTVIPVIGFCILQIVPFIPAPAVRVQVETIR